MRQFFTRKLNKNKNRERGIAMFMALVALLLLAAIAAGMMFMANTETTINYNYRDAQYTYFAAGAGLEDARELMRNDGYPPKYIPQKAPAPGNAMGIIYILNPAAGEQVVPWDMNPNNPYRDDELCHEYSRELGITDNGVNNPCVEGPPAGSYSTPPIPTSLIAVNGQTLSGSRSALAYKWVRITLKLNKTLVPPSNPAHGYPVDTSGTAGDSDLVCWGNAEGHEFTIAGNMLPKSGPKQYPSEFELAALNKAIEMGLGTPAVFMFGGKGKSSSTSGTTTGTTTSTTTGSTTSTTTGSTTSTSTGSTSGTTSGTTTSTTTGTSSGSTTGTTSGSTTGTTTTGSSSGTTTGGTTTGGGGAIGTPVGAGYYQLVDECNKKNKFRYSVYLVTSMAVGRNGTKRMAQYEISRNSFPGIPGGLTFNGPGATFAPPTSNNYSIDGHDHAQKDIDPGDPGYVAGVPGKCPGPSKTGVHAITTFDSSTASTVSASLSQYPGNYTGLGSDTSEDFNDDGNITSDEEFRDSNGNLLPPISPDVVDGSAVDPRTGQVPLDGLTTVKENNDLVASLIQSADLLVTGNVNSISDIKSRNPGCASIGAPMGSSDPNVYKTAPVCYGPKITTIEGNAQMSNVTGTGILLVTGDLTLGGNVNWDGLILVIGTGNLSLSGGGNKTINGGVYVAKTKQWDPSTQQYVSLTSLGSPNVNYNGGGTAALSYNSCKIAQAVNNQSFRVITYREMTY